VATLSRLHDPTTLSATLEHAAERAPERGLAIFEGRGHRFERRSWPEVLARVAVAAGRWRTLGVRPGDRVLVCHQTSWGWLESWFGAVWCGALPVAVAPPGGLGGAISHVHKLDALRSRLGARLIAAAGSQHTDALSAGLGELAAAIRTPSDLALVTPGSRLPHPAAAEDLAFLQLTSGSTGFPRAVAISHRAALHNAIASDRAIGAPRGEPVSRHTDAMVSWLPLHHDMGLVGCLFLSITCGLDLWLLPPTTFLAKPRRWLEELGQRGRVFAPAPNFGYQLCLERLSAEERSGLDLSRWSDAMTGAEMVRPETIAGFCEAFAAAGFRPEVFRPCYGLAEATLAVTFDQRGAGVRTKPLPAGGDLGLGLREVVTLGTPIAETEVAIVGPDLLPLPDGAIGEVWVRGPSVFSGYYNDPEATAASLRDGWLATGDLGFLEDGELALTGRSKDVLILRGHNLMPHELEWLAEAVVGGGGALRSGAFTVAHGAEGEIAVLVVETAADTSSDLVSQAQAIRQRVGRELGLPLADIAFVRRGRIPKTTSGKVQRRELRARYLAGELERLDHQS
jgi:fatty-acyl-CoA synthase